MEIRRKRYRIDIQINTEREKEKKRDGEKRANSRRIVVNTIKMWSIVSQYSGIFVGWLHSKLSVHI